MFRSLFKTAKELCHFVISYHKPNQRRWLTEYEQRQRKKYRDILLIFAVFILPHFLLAAVPRKFWYQVDETVINFLQFSCRQLVNTENQQKICN